jgi:hypothetical protein
VGWIFARRLVAHIEPVISNGGSPRAVDKDQDALVGARLMFVVDRFGLKSLFQVLRLALYRCDGR